MKNITALLLGFVLLIPFSDRAQAREKAETKIAGVKQEGDKVVFTLSSSRPFIFADNRYILHVGNKDIYSSRQSIENGKGRMTFLIQADDFSALQEGSNIYLTYGQPTTDYRDLEELSKADQVPCWALGKFSKTLLTK